MRPDRSTIAGLVGIALVAALGLMALRNASPIWLGTMELLGRAVLILAIVLAIYRRGAARAWWLGFCLFAWGYLNLVERRFEVSYTIFGTRVVVDPQFPTTFVTLAIRPRLGPPATAAPPNPGGPSIDYYYIGIGHRFWAMVAGLLGAVLARMVFAWSRNLTDPGEAAAAGPTPRRRWVRLMLAGWVGLVLLTSAAAIRSPGRGDFWAGATFLLTLGLLGLAGVGAIGVRGPRRGAWLGAALLGGGYFLLVFTSNPFLPRPAIRFLEALREGAPVIANSTVTANLRIRKALERPIPMRFPESTTLGDLLAYIKKATATPGSPALPIYIDPIGLQEAERTMSSEVTIDLEDVPLEVTLRLCLRQLGMVYIIKDGLLWITSEDSELQLTEDFPDPDGYSYWKGTLHGSSTRLGDPYLIVGHCLLALLGAGLGAVAGPMVAWPGAPSTVPLERS